MKLHQIAHILSGTYSTSINNGEVYYLQARDFDEARNLSSNLTPTLSYTDNLGKHFLQNGDVLIVIKGGTFLSAVFNATVTPAVASTVFLIIRLNNHANINPYFLSWFLNLKTTQKRLTLLARGTSIPSINKHIIEDLEIPIPILKKQNTILKLIQLSEEEKNITQKIKELKEKQFNYLILNTLKN